MDKKYTNTYSHQAFTLAEILITLGIIGVISAMTLPTLITNYRAKRLQSQFFKSYSTLKQVFKKMDAEGDLLSPQYYYGTNKLYKAVAKHLQGATNCGNFNGQFYEENAPCYGVKTGIGYKNLTQTNSFNGNLLDDGGLAMPDGTLIMFENPTGSNSIYITVDLNGYSKPPNAIGYDTFVFQFVDSDLLPMGAPGTDYSATNTYCDPTSNTKYNGISCAQKVLNDSNYFKSVVRNFK